MIELKKKMFILTLKLHDDSHHHMQPRSRGVHSPIQSSFNPKIQPNWKIVFLINITEPNREPVLFGWGQFFSIQNQKNRNIFVAAVVCLNLGRRDCSWRLSKDEKNQNKLMYTLIWDTHLHLATDCYCL